MHKYKVLFLLFLVVSTHALNCPNRSDCQYADSHRIHKREAEYIHSIHVERAKEKLMEAYQEIRPFLDDLVADVAPTIHEKFSQTYMPALRSFLDEVMPFFNAKVYPQIQKYYKFGLNVADKLIGKTYRAYKLSNSTHLAVISISDLIDETFNEFKPILDMARYLSSRMMANDGHYRGKRHVSEISGNIVDGNFEEVHIIDIENLKAKLIEAYQEFKPLVEDLLSEISPSIYDEFTASYIPKLQEIVNIVSPFMNSKIYSQAQKYIKFASSIAEKLVDKVYRSYQLSNSSHINIVSISEIIDEVYTEAKPILDLGKYLSMRMTMNGRHYRGKRDLSGQSEATLVRHKRQMPEFLMAMVSPFIEDMANSITDTFFGGSNSIPSKILFPFIYEVMSDPESRYDVGSLYMLAKAAFSPIFLEMMKVQNYNTPEGTIIQIPRHMYVKAIEQLRVQARPIVNKLMMKHLRSLFRYAQDGADEVADLISQLMFEKYDGADVMLDQYFEFMNKHKGLFKSSPSSHVQFYTIKEIMNDLQPLKISAVRVLVQYMRRNPDSWMNTLFGESSWVKQLVVGSPTYAKPAATPRPYVARAYKKIKRN